MIVIIILGRESTRNDNEPKRAEKTCIEYRLGNAFKHIQNLETNFYSILR